MGFLVNSFIEFPTAVFSPADISGLTLWLDSSEGVTKDGSNLVSQWDDQSGNSNNVVQATTANKPIWVDSTLNGLPVIRFDGTNDDLSKSTFTGGAISQAFYIFVVIKPAAGGSGAQYNWDHANGTRGWCYTLLSGGTDYFNYGCAIDVNIETLPTGYVQYTFLVSGASSDIRRDKTSVNSNNLGSSTINGFWLGSRHSSVQYGNPDIAEFLIYDSNIGDTDRDKVETYLADKYGL